jgi:hypothetical protein
LTNVAIHGFTYGLTAFRADLSNVDISGNSVGAGTSRLFITNSSISQNSTYGLTAIRVRATGSTITGNGLDVFSVRKPRFRTTSCETSLHVDSLANPIGTWGICSLD